MDFYSRSLRKYYWAALAIAATFIFNCTANATDTPFRPAVLFQGEMPDGSYLHLIDKGITRFESQSNLEVHRIKMAANNDIYLKKLRKAAENGYNPIVVHDSNAISSFPELAKEFPLTRFVSIDVAYHVPNILGLTFNHAEGAYIIGYLAGLKTSSNQVGFIGGIDIPVINHFKCGFEIGVQDANPSAQIIASYINKGTLSWDDKQSASDIAQDMLAEGVDVIFPVAGYAGTGAMEAIQEHGNSYSFGVDNDYSTEFPNTSIASLEKRVDVAVFAALIQLKSGIWNQNQKHFGIKQNVISIALNNNNPALTESDKQAVVKLVADFKNQNSLNAEHIESRCSI